MNLMEGLSGWLKQIVAAVLLASLVDLLLPNRTMQRYVRLVAGLFVLLTVATPLLNWMQNDFGGKLAAELDAAARPRSNSQEQEQLSRIQEEGAKLRQRQNEAAADLAALRLAEAMKAGIEDTEKRRVRKVDVRMGTHPDGSVSVRAVTVSLEPSEAQAGGADGAFKAIDPIAEVAPVAPVAIEIGRERDTVEAGAVPEGTAGEKPDRSTRLRIAAFLAARYGIPAESVIVTETAPN